MKLRSVALCFLFAVGALAERFDVVVIGATPGGIAAAIAAARHGHTVALAEYRTHVGGMSASGLGKSDITKADAIGGLWDEFVGRVRDYYKKTYGENSDQFVKCKDGYFYEPSVAEKIFNEMLAEQKSIKLFLGYRMMETFREYRTLTGVKLINRSTAEIVDLRGAVFIDATYEGDLAALAGAEYRAGRESRAEFNEANAGVIYMDHKTRALLPGTTGEGDDRLVAYTYRLCLTNNPDNRILPKKPDGYSRDTYVNYFLDLKLGRIDSMVKALSIAEIPNQKYDVNMKPWPLGFPFAEMNKGYAEADWDLREYQEKRLRNTTLGLLYFLQNDPEVPEADRALAQTYGLPKDEFTDNENFPWCLYVREARRIVGEYTLSERDLMLAPESGRAPVHEDAISAGEFPIDSFPTRRYEPGHEEALEGYILMLDKLTQPYQIPYRVMIPKDIDGLIVPVACSATHIAFSSVRLEPTWMSLGEAAGVAAHWSISQGQPPRHIMVGFVQQLLISNGSVLTYFEDLAKDHPAFKMCQYLGTRGYFADYNARPNDPFTVDDAERAVKARFTLPSYPEFGKRKPDSYLSASEWTAICRVLAQNRQFAEGLPFKESVPIANAVSRADAFVILHNCFDEDFLNRDKTTEPTRPRHQATTGN